MNTEESQTINAFALRELATMMKISDDELDNHIRRVRDKMMENSDVRISEAIPGMIAGRNMDDIMTGVILSTFATDYYFDQYINGNMK